MERKDLVFDFDSTMIKTSKILLNIYNYETNNNLEYNATHGWDFDGLFPVEYCNRAFELFLDKSFYDERFFEAMEDMIEIVNQLAEKNNVTIATNQHPTRRPNTDAWVKKHMPNVKIKYFNSFDKSEMSGFIFVDDRIDALESVKNNFEHIICFGEYGWNKEWTGKRVLSWKEIDAFINSVSQ